LELTILCVTVGYLQLWAAVSTPVVLE